MPAASIDTFFACSLMVLLALSAMAGASKILSPYIDGIADKNAADRYKQISERILLDCGAPLGWGSDGTRAPDVFGLGDAFSSGPFTLDIDKVSRLSGESAYAVDYAHVFAAFQMPDVSFNVEIGPLFEVNASLTATYSFAGETVYEFAMVTERQGAPVSAVMKCYVVADGMFWSSSVMASEGKLSLNITLPSDVGGPALLVTIARCTADAAVSSWNVFAFAHNSSEPAAKGSILRLSPLNYSLTSQSIIPDVNISSVYALAFNYNSSLPKIAGDAQSSVYNVPRYCEPGPTILVATGLNSSAFFSEWASYPCVPLKLGADLAGRFSLSNVYACRYVVRIGGSLYECIVRAGGERG